MSTPAKVHSSEAIDAVRMALMAFVQQVGDALTELSAEMRRMQEWLEHDRPRHWKMQVRRAVDGAHEAQQALHRCIMFPIANERPSCTEERAALKRARARLAYCEEKEDKVRKWQQTMRHEMFEYEGRISQLVRLVEIDVPQAIGVLNKILRNLEEYHAVKARDPRAAYDDMAMVRTIWDETDETDGAEQTDPGEVASAAGENTSANPVAPNPTDTTTKEGS